MQTKRTDDLKAQTRFRSNRVFEYSGKWFFFTREGTIEGPFEDQLEAGWQVEMYIKVMGSGQPSADGELSLEPLELTPSG